MAHRGRCRSQGSFYFEFGFDVDFYDILYNDHEYHDPGLHKLGQLVSWLATNEDFFGFKGYKD